MGIGAGLLGLGVGTSALSSLFGSNPASQVTAGGQFQRQDLSSNQQQLLQSLYGAGGGVSADWNNYRAYQIISGKPAPDPNTTIVQTGPYAGQSYAAAMAAQQQAQGGPIIQQQQQLANRFINQGNAQQSVFNNQMAGLTAQGQQNAGLASNYGRNSANLINQQYNLANTSANNATQALANATGLGASSVVGNQIAGNNQTLGLARSQALQGAAQSAAQLQTGVNQTNIANQFSQNQASQNLWNQLQNNKQTLRFNPVNTMLNAQEGSILSPVSNAASYQYTPYSAAGTALGGIGNTSALLGASGSNTLSTLFPNLFGSGGSGGGGSAGGAGIVGS